MKNVSSTILKALDPLREYREDHFKEVEDIGIAFNHNRVWICLNGRATLRAKVMDGKLFIEYHPPSKEQDE